MTITDSTINTSVWTDVKAKLVAAAPFVTNSTTSATTAASIQASWNDKDYVKSTPYVVIQPIQKDTNKNKFGNENNNKHLINVIVDYIYKNTLGIDQMTDQVETALDADDIAGINLTASVSSYTFGEANGAKFHVKSTTFVYDRE